MITPMPWVETAHMQPGTKSMVVSVNRASAARLNLNLRFLGNEQPSSVHDAKNFCGREPKLRWAFSINK